MNFDRIVVLINLMSTIAVGVGAIALTVVSIRLTSDFNNWQKSTAARQAEELKRSEVNSKAEKLKDHCIEMAKYGTELAQRSKPSKVMDVLKFVGDMDPRCSSVGPGITAISAALVVKSARAFDDETVARAIMIVDQIGSRRFGFSSKTDADQKAGEDFDPRRSKKLADGIIGDALGGKAYAIGPQELSVPKGITEAPSNAPGPTAEDGAGEVKGASTLRADPGMSVMWNSPMGPIRFDFARILKEDPADKTETFKFSTATRF